jgi:hypothetical protein
LVSVKITGGYPNWVLHSIIFLHNNKTLGILGIKVSLALVRGGVGTLFAKTLVVISTTTIYKQNFTP